MARSKQMTKTPQASAGESRPANDALEQRVVAFAEQLGRIVGTVQAKADGWLDPTALHEQVTRVRDGAASLLQQLGATTEPRSERNAPERGGGAAMTKADRGARAPRSGGVVDATGKKHRKPVPDAPVRSLAADGGRPTKSTRTSGSKRRGRG